MWQRVKSNRIVLFGALALTVVGLVAWVAPRQPQDRGLRQFLNYRTLDGSDNNHTNPELGMAGTVYTRVAEPNYADGVGEMVESVDARFVSNRIYNDQAHNLFSENGVTHWGFVWGQFLDHSIGLRETGGEALILPFNLDDPLEEFENDAEGLGFERSAVAPATGNIQPREQVNTVSSYIDAFAVYGGSAERLDWLRVGSVDGDPTNNSAELLLTDDGFLPTSAERPDATTPSMDLMGALFMSPQDAIIAGDIRANENLGLTAVQTLFAREHNRIVAALPEDLPEEVKFAIARRVVAATQQYITYEEFLPAFGIDLPRYRGYDAAVDPTITNEFATVGYRAHSFIHGEFEMAGELADYTPDQLDALEAQGIEVFVEGDEVEFAIPLNIAFGRPQLLNDIGLGPVLVGLSSEPQYANDEMIDNQLRSVLFQIPSPTASDPAACLDGVDLPDCFIIVNDLGVLDMMRAFDHGMPSYNELRVAYGLAPVTSFAEITGEDTEEFPTDALIDSDDPINDPDILDVIAFFDVEGNKLTQEEVDAGAEATTLIRRSTLAARLKAIYGSVANIDAFTGMISEMHVSGTEFGELQLAMWEQQFSDLRDGDRFFYANDRVLRSIERRFDISYRQTLAELIANNTSISAENIPTNVFVTD